jgi:hypothetical protein
MKELGSPTIRVINVGGEIYALEGSHRLAAAQKLDIKPILIEMRLEDEIPADLEILDRNGTQLSLNSIRDVVVHLNTDTPYQLKEPLDWAGT